MPNKKHEREICDLVVALRFERDNEILQEHWYPEDEIPPPPKAIDAIYRTNIREYVVEHTIIESYSSQIAEDYKVSKLLTLLEDKIVKKITEEGHYVILLNTETLKDQKINTALVETLYNWVVEKAPRLEIGNPGTAPRHMIKDVLIVKGRHIEISLYRWPNTHVRVSFKRVCPENQEEKLSAQAQAALRKKIPKLTEWQKNRNAFSILILESVDTALVNGPTLFSAIIGTIQQSVEQPDIIYIVQTDRDEAQVWECSPPFGPTNFVDMGYIKLKNLYEMKR